MTRNKSIKITDLDEIKQKKSWVIDDLTKSGLTLEYIKKHMHIYIIEGNKSDHLIEVLGYSVKDNHLIDTLSDYYYIGYPNNGGFARAKLEKPYEDKNGTVKYLNPRRPKQSHLFFTKKAEKLLGKVKAAVLWTEGEKKAAKLDQESKGKYLAIGAPGVSIWENCPEMKEITYKSRKFYNFYDSDFSTNPQVEKQILSWWLFINKKGGKPYLCTWSKKHKGIDDLLYATKTTIAQLLKKAENNIFKILSLNENDVAYYLHKHGYTSPQISALWQKYDLETVYKVSAKVVKDLTKEKAKAETKTKTKVKKKPHGQVIKEFQGQEGIIWIVCVDGIYKKKLNEEGQWVTKRISPNPVSVESLYVDINTNDAIAEIKTGKRKIEFSLDDLLHSGQIRNLTKKGVKFSSRHKEDAACFFEDVVSDMEQKEMSFKNGWTIDKKHFVLGNKIIGEEKTESIKFTGKAYVPEADGYKLEWLDEIKKFNFDPQICIAMCASAVSPALSILGVRSFSLHFWGNSSTGKSFATMIGASLWGNPNKIIERWSSTEAGCETYFEEAGGLPSYFDESQQAKDEHVIQSIYQFGNQKGKGRGTLRDGSTRRAESKEWNGILISTGEHTISTLSPKGGIQARIIEIKREPARTEKTKEEMAIEIEEAKSVLDESFGFYAEKIIHYILSNKEELKRKNKENRNYFSKNIKSENYIQGRVFPYAATILTGAHILKQIGVPLCDINLIENSLLESMKEGAPKSTTEKAIEYLESLVAANRNKFYEKGKTEAILEGLSNEQIMKIEVDEYVGNEKLRMEFRNECWGRVEKEEVDEKGKGTYIVNFFPHVLREKLKEGGFDESVIKLLRSEKKILHKKDKSARYVRIFNKIERVISIVFEAKSEDESVKSCSPL